MAAHEETGGNSKSIRKKDNTCLNLSSVTDVKNEMQKEWLKESLKKIWGLGASGNSLVASR